MLDVIIPYSDRIESLDLSVREETLFAITSNENTFPSLQSIKIDTPYPYDLDPPNTWRALENAPALCRVYFYDLLHPETLRLPWIQLTHLFFGNRVRIRQWTCLDILQQCPNLESCVFLRIKATSQNPSVHAQVLHSSLQSLQVGTHTSLSTFFNCLTLPALRNIHVACDPGYLQFVSFLARSLCHIERFVIDMPLPPRYFIQIIQSMPRLAELDIRVYPSSTSFHKMLQQITLAGNSGCDLCPLERCDLSVRGQSQSKGGEVLNCIRKNRKRQE
jgi:hypothetical protein